MTVLRGKADRDGALLPGEGFVGNAERVTGGAPVGDGQIRYFAVWRGGAGGDGGT